MTNISADQSGKYGFLVNPKANKIEIKKAIEKKLNIQSERPPLFFFNTLLMDYNYYNK